MATADVQKIRCYPLPRTHVRSAMAGERSRIRVRSASRELFLTSVLPENSLRRGETEACDRTQNLKSVQAGKQKAILRRVNSLATSSL